MKRHPVYPDNSIKNKTWVLDDPEQAVAEFTQFVSDHVTVVVLGKFVGDKVKVKRANDLCMELEGPNKPPTRVLWIQDEEVFNALRDGIVAAIKANEEALRAARLEINPDKIRAFSMHRKEAKVLYTIPKGPLKKGERFARPSIKRAMNAVVKATLNPAT